MQEIFGSIAWDATATLPKPRNNVVHNYSPIPWLIACRENIIFSSAKEMCTAHSGALHLDKLLCHLSHPPLTTHWHYIEETITSPFDDCSDMICSFWKLEELQHVVECMTGSRYSASMLLLFKHEVKKLDFNWLVQHGAVRYHWKSDSLICVSTIVFFTFE